MWVYLVLIIILILIAAYQRARKDD